MARWLDGLMGRWIVGSMGVGQKRDDGTMGYFGGGVGDGLMSRWVDGSLGGWMGQWVGRQWDNGMMGVGSRDNETIGFGSRVDGFMC